MKTAENQRRVADRTERSPLWLFRTAMRAVGSYLFALLVGESIATELKRTTTETYHRGWTPKPRIEENTSSGANQATGSSYDTRCSGRRSSGRSRAQHCSCRSMGKCIEACCRHASSTTANRSRGANCNLRNYPITWPIITHRSTCTLRSQSKRKSRENHFQHSITPKTLKSNFARFCDFTSTPLRPAHRDGGHI